MGATSSARVILVDAGSAAVAAGSRITIAMIHHTTTAANSSTRSSSRLLVTAPEKLSLHTQYKSFETRMTREPKICTWVRRCSKGPCSAQGLFRFVWANEWQESAGEAHRPVNNIQQALAALRVPATVSAAVCVRRRGLSSWFQKKKHSKGCADDSKPNRWHCCSSKVLIFKVVAEPPLPVVEGEPARPHDKETPHRGLCYRIYPLCQGHERDQHTPKGHEVVAPLLYLSQRFTHRSVVFLASLLVHLRFTSLRQFFSQELCLVALFRDEEDVSHILIWFPVLCFLVLFVALEASRYAWLFFAFSIKFGPDID